MDEDVGDAIIKRLKTEIQSQKSEIARLRNELKKIEKMLNDNSIHSMRPSDDVAYLVQKCIELWAPPIIQFSKLTTKK